MKPNLLNTSTPKKQRKQLIVNIVVYGSMILSCISIVSVQVIQLQKLWEAKKKYNKEALAAQQFDCLVKQEKKLKEEVAQIQKILGIITEQYRTNKLFSALLQSIINIISPSNLKRLEFSEQKIKITVCAPSLEVLQAYINQCTQQNWCNTIHMCSLETQKDESIYRAIIVIDLDHIQHHVKKTTQ